MSGWGRTDNDGDGIMSELTRQLHKTNVAKCYQCGKCTAGCPVADRMDLRPHQLMLQAQLAGQLGDKSKLDRAATAKSLWTCVSCLTCSTRCPQSVDVAGCIDVLREYALSHHLVPFERARVMVFQRAFLDSVRRNGRVNEVEMTVQFKTQSFLKDFSVPDLMKDSMLAPKLMQRGKFHLMGEKVRDRDLVRRIFERCAVKPLSEQQIADDLAKAKEHSA